MLFGTTYTGSQMLLARSIQPATPITWWIDYASLLELVDALRNENAKPLRSGICRGLT